METQNSGNYTDRDPRADGDRNTKKDTEDYNKVLTQGPWIIFGQYLTVQPWTKTFNLTQPYPSVVMASIRLLDLQTDNRTRGRFARLAVIINLDKPLVSQVSVDGAVQRVKYEALPTVCFCRGKYGHVKELCPLVVANLASGSSVDAAVASSGDNVGGGGKNTLGSRFSPLIVEDVLGGDLGGFNGGFLGEKEAGSEVVVVRGNKAKVSSKRDLGYAIGVDRGIEEGFRSSVGPTMGLSNSKPGVIEKGQDKDAVSLKSLGKKPVGSDGFFQNDKDLRNKLSFSNFISLIPSAGLAQSKEDDARMNGPLNEKLGGPGEDRPRQAGPLAYEGLSPIGLDITVLNGKNINLDKQRFGGIAPKDILGQELVEMQSGSSENAGTKLVLNNPMFKGPSETVVNLDANLLDPNHHLAVIINENNVSKAFKEAISSMANLINSQVGLGAEEIGGNADGQIGGLGSTFV
ncbi:hypothetical protein GOBAR_DD18220 [Gossypium barbadense]|nr:hypothetical protein GOBAR_DD18220 [Gossypium barbadense]